MYKTEFISRHVRFLGRTRPAMADRFTPMIDEPLLSFRGSPTVAFPDCDKNPRPTPLQPALHYAQGACTHTHRIHTSYTHMHAWITQYCYPAPRRYCYPRDARMRPCTQRITVHGAAWCGWPSLRVVRHPNELAFNCGRLHESKLCTRASLHRNEDCFAFALKSFSIKK